MADQNLGSAFFFPAVRPDGGGHCAVHCVGADDLVRGHQSIFLTQLDSPVPVDPNDTRLIPDQSDGYKMAKLFLEAQLRQTPATGVEPDLDGLGAFKVMDFQIDTVRHALTRLRPRLVSPTTSASARPSRSA